MATPQSNRAVSAGIRPFVPVRPGDRVAVVTPSSPVREEMLEAGVAAVRSLGFVPAVGDGVLDRWRWAAGPDERRLGELRRALQDPEIRAVWLARGGYGVTPLLARLVDLDLAADPKPIVGESDATALGCLALARGVPWLHGPMVATKMREADGFDRASLIAALAGQPFLLSEPRAAAVTLGRAQGVLWGGCLSLLAALAGTPWMPRIRGGILVAEDVGVKPYQVHRMLVQLRDAGALEDVAGVVLGDWSDCVQHADQGYDMADVFRDAFAEIAPGAPVSMGWPIGHAPSSHLTLAMGWNATLVAETSGSTLRLEPPR